MRYVDRPDSDEMKEVQKELDRTGKYNCEKLKEYLSNTYKGLCAYCECEVEVSNFLEVEHFYPKSHFDFYKLDIHNLHLACKRCNNPKGSKTDSLLSPNYYKTNPSDTISPWLVTSSEQLQQKIRYCGHLLYSPCNDPAAKNTISILRLNNENKDDKRELLIESRLRVYNTAVSYILIICDTIKILLEGIENEYVKEDYYNSIIRNTKLPCDSLKKMMMHGEPYSQMIIDNFYLPLEQLKGIIMKIEPPYFPDRRYKDKLKIVKSMVQKIEEYFQTSP